MKDKYRQLRALLLAGTIAVSGVGLSGCSSKDTDTPHLTVIEESVKTFGIGEHILTVPIEKDIRKDVFQYEYIPGYEPVGISVSAYGTYSNSYGGGSIVYQNTEEVTCYSDSVDASGQYMYLNFGSTDENANSSSPVVDGVKEFAPGEHIISIPLNQDIRDERFQVQAIDGYELVGIATSANGTYSNKNCGGVLLFKNIETVRCTSAGNGFTTFGIPVVETRSLGR